MAASAASVSESPDTGAQRPRPGRQRGSAGGVGTVCEHPDPLPLTGGSETPTPPLPLTHGDPRWDWYQATIDRDGLDVTDHLQAVLGCSAHLEAKGQLGYSHQVRLARGDRPMAVVFAGGQSGTMVRSSGAEAHEVGGVLRAIFPDHRVSRVDVAIDFDGGSAAWDAAAAVLEDLALSSNIDASLIRDPVRDRGRTLYLGSPKSEVRGRLYEKGLKDAPETHPGWVRWETQVRPQHKAQKALTATLTPRQAAGYARWSREALMALFGLHSSPLPPRPERLGDDARALATLVDQYGQVLARQAASKGWDQLWPELQRMILSRHADACSKLGLKTLTGGD